MAEVCCQVSFDWPFNSSLYKKVIVVKLKVIKL